MLGDNDPCDWRFKEPDYCHRKSSPTWITLSLASHQHHGGVQFYVVNVLMERFCFIFSADRLFRFSSSCFFWCSQTTIIIPIRIMVPIKIAINFFVKSFILSECIGLSARNICEWRFFDDFFDRNWQLINLSWAGHLMTVFYFAFEYARFIILMPEYRFYAKIQTNWCQLKALKS